MARRTKATTDRDVSHDEKLGGKLVDYVQDALAMEKNVETMLISMIASSDDGVMKDQMEAHLEETKEHITRLETRLEAMSEGRSPRKEVQAVAPSLLKVFRRSAAWRQAGKECPRRVRHRIPRDRRVRAASSDWASTRATP